MELDTSAIDALFNSGGRATEATGDFVISEVVAGKPKESIAISWGPIRHGVHDALEFLGLRDAEQDWRLGCGKSGQFVRRSVTPQMIAEKISSDGKKVGFDGLLANFSARSPSTDECFLTKVLGECAITTQEVRKGGDLSGVASEQLVKVHVPEIRSRSAPATSFSSR